MTALRMFLSIPLAAVAAMSLVGCYDLSTSGPTPDDFMRTKSPAAQSQDQQTLAEVRCGELSTACTAPENDTASAVLDALEEQDEQLLVEARSKLRIVADDLR